MRRIGLYLVIPIAAAALVCAVVHLSASEDPNDLGSRIDRLKALGEERRVEAIRALTQVPKEDAENAVALLLALVALTDQSVAVRAVAAASVADLDTRYPNDARSAVCALALGKVLAEDPDLRVKIVVGQALGRFSNKETAALALVKAAQDAEDDWQTAVGAIDGLALCDTKLASVFLASQILSNPNPSVKQRAAIAIGQHGVGALDSLLKMTVGVAGFPGFAGNSEYVTTVAYYAVKKIVAKTTWEQCLELIKHDDSVVRRSAAARLVELDRKRGTDVVQTHLTSGGTYRGDAKVMQGNVFDAVKIDLTVADGRLTLEKKGGSWKLSAPKGSKAVKAEESAVTDLLNALRDLMASVWVDVPADKKVYGLDKPRAEIVLSIRGSTTDERILVGSESKSGLLAYVQLAASASVAVVRVEGVRKLLTPVLGYRDRSVMRFVKSRADRIELARKDTTVVLAKEKGTWKMIEPVSADADTDAVNDLLADMSSLKATQIAGEGDLPRYGLDKPGLKVTVRVQPPEPKLHVLHVAKEGEKVYGVVIGGNLVYELSQAVYDNLTAEMHDRKPLKFETSKATGVDVVGGEKPLKFAKKDDKWSYVPDPHFTIDEKKVTDLLTGLHNLKVERYVAYAAKDLKPFGLDKPDLTVTIRQEDAKPIIMLLSKADKDGKRKATIKAEPGKMKVFIVTKSDVEKFAKKVGDFAKS